MVVPIHRRNSHLLCVVVELEAVLVLCGAIVPTNLTADVRNQRNENSRDESEDESGDERLKSRHGPKGPPRRTAKTKKGEDSGSELDM